MPILALGPDGRMYVTSGDTSVGSGYGYHPEVVEEGDLTLGSAYLKSQNHQRNQLVKNAKEREHMTAMDAGLERQRKLNAQKQREQHAREERQLDNHGLQDALKKRALSMGCECDPSTPMDGNVMSANGMTGFNGMSRDQQAIHHAVTGMGRNTAYSVDPIEKRQHEMKKDAQRIMHLKARR